MSKSVFEQVSDIISERLGFPFEDITLEADLKEDLSADSLDIMELVMELESEFDIEIADEELEQISSVSDIVEYIESRQ